MERAVKVREGSLAAWLNSAVPSCCERLLAIKVLSCREMNAGQSVAPGHKKTEMPCHGAGIDMAELRSETGLEELRPETGMEELRSWTDMAELRPETGM